MYTVDESEYLEHYGRKGMKWGSHIFGLEKKVSSEIGKGVRKVKKYNAIRKERKKQVQSNPYGEENNRTKKQMDRLLRDTINYGNGGVKRIQKDISKGHSYNSAKRIENGRRFVTSAVLTAASLDFVTGGEFHRAVGNAAIKTAKGIGKGIGKTVVSEVARNKVTKIGAGVVFDVASKKWVRAS